MSLCGVLIFEGTLKCFKNWTISSVWKACERHKEGTIHKYFGHECNKCVILYQLKCPILIIYLQGQEINKHHGNRKYIHSRNHKYSQCKVNTHIPTHHSTQPPQWEQLHYIIVSNLSHSCTLELRLITCTNAAWNELVHNVVALGPRGKTRHVATWHTNTMTQVGMHYWLWTNI